MNKALLKRVLCIVGSVLFFLILSYSFVPQVLDGKIVDQSDISGYVGMAHEAETWNKANPDDPALWTGSMFSGMPTVSIMQITKGDHTTKLYDLMLWGKRPASYLFITLLGAFLLLLAFGVKWWIAVGGAVAMAFCSYNFQIIQVGHNSKMQALAFLPYVLAALVYTYRRATADDGKISWSRVLLGSALFGLAVSLQVKANHQQISYYLALVIALYVITLFISLLISHRQRIGKFFIASGLLLVLGIAGLATNANKLLPLLEYTPYTMRGGSELVAESGTKSKNLDLDYATQWSYGWEELPNLLIPNFNGGSSSAAVNPDKSETINLLRRSGQKNLRQTAKHLPMYWGPQPFTAGPMYLGAITVFLFVLGLCLYRGKEKWWLLAATILAVLLSLGNHFMAFTKLCFDLLPMYGKFRTVSMSLTVLQYSFPLLGFLVLDSIVKKEYAPAEFKKGLLIATAVTAGFAFVCAICPSLVGSFSAASDDSYGELLAEAFAADRRMLLVSDAWMTVVYVLLAAGLIFFGYSSKNEKVGNLTAALVCVLVCVNLFTVGKRYLNEEHFVTPKSFHGQFDKRPVDEYILSDPAESYRVLDLTANVFNDSHASYHHKNVGGYSPAKLQRYQDFIDFFLAGEINEIYGALGEAATIQEAEAALPFTPALNALNTKYIILGDNIPPVENYRADGNAWFPDEAIVAYSATEEMSLTKEYAFAGGFRGTAVVAGEVEGLSVEASEGDRIELVKYSPNEMTYSYNVESSRLAVFGEVWYPGWKLCVDGEDIPLLRSNWLFRAAQLPAGEHQLVMTFSPTSYSLGAGISLSTSILLLLTVLLSALALLLSSRATSRHSE